MVADWFRQLRIPIRDPRFWVIQMLVLVIDIGHLLLEHTQVLLGESELYLLSVSVFLIPVVYAALAFGLRGAVPTALCAGTKRNAPVLSCRRMNFTEREQSPQ